MVLGTPARHAHVNTDDERRRRIPIDEMMPIHLPTFTSAQPDSITYPAGWAQIK